MINLEESNKYDAVDNRAVLARCAKAHCCCQRAEQRGFRASLMDGITFGFRRMLDYSGVASAVVDCK